jgi:annexin A7/11
MSRWPADANAMADILTDRSTAEIDAIEAEYQRRYGVSLRQRIRDMTGGDTEMALLAQLDRRDGTELRASTLPGANDRRAATQTARDVHQALNRVPLPDTDALIRLLGNATNAELREIKAAYQEMYGQSLEQAVKNRTGGDFEDAMAMMLAGNRSEATHADPTQASRDAAALREAVEGWGTDEEAISRMLAQKSPAELRAIAQAYREMYGESLRERIDDETSGAYCKLLLSRLDAAGC